KLDQLRAYIKETMSGYLSREDLGLPAALALRAFMTLRRNLKKNFLAFSLGAKGQQMMCRLGSALPHKACPLSHACTPCSIFSPSPYVRPASLDCLRL
ncbi:hypothetical protein QJQ45_025167, partial [Haematococcus lacustris]